MCFLAAAVVAFFAIVVVDAGPPTITSMLPCSAKSLKKSSVLVEMKLSDV